MTTGQLHAGFQAEIQAGLQVGSDVKVQAGRNFELVENVNCKNTCIRDVSRGDRIPSSKANVLNIWMKIIINVMVATEIIKKRSFFGNPCFDTKYNSHFVHQNQKSHHKVSSYPPDRDSDLYIVAAIGSVMVTHSSSVVR